MAEKIKSPRLLIIAERSYCSSFEDWKNRIVEIQQFLPGLPSLGLQIRNKTENALTELPILLSHILPSSQIWLNGIIQTNRDFQRHLPEDDIESAPQYPIFASSIHSPTALQKALIFQPHFLQYGAVFPTSKPVQPLGLENLKQICKRSVVPILAVGGINSSEKIIQCQRAGAWGVSIGSWIMQHPNMKALIEDIL